MSVVSIDPRSRVLAFSDPHGVRSGLAAGLMAAGLIDAAERWVAPAGTALVGVGDYIDRGTRSAQLLELVFRLADEARDAGSSVVLCRGNHEALLLDVLAGKATSYKVWMTDFAGGAATAASFGIDPVDTVQGVERLAAALRAKHPELEARLRAMPDAAVWRDVLFCHAGPPANSAPEHFGRFDNFHLWEFPAFDRPDIEEYDLSSDLFDGYRAAGIGRYVFGHQSHAAPVSYQDGRALCIDTNTASGDDTVSSATFQLLEIPAAGSLRNARAVVIDTSAAPDRG